MIRKPRIGLCLSGGGVYGAFQAGVIQSLHEAGVRVEMFAGSSIGAINAILAAHRDPALLQRFWLNLPESIRREMEFAQKQWMACVLALGRAKRIGTDAAKEYFRNLSLGGKAWSWVWAFQDCVEEGEVATRAYLNDTLREIEASGPLISIVAVDHMRTQLSRSMPRVPVYATVCELKSFQGQHLLRMGKQRHSEVTNTGDYKEVDVDNAVAIGLASASLPMVFGRNNSINPTHYLDGGLFDNLPTVALEDYVSQGAIDCILVIDVSRNAKAFRDKFEDRRISRNTPCLYIGLSKEGDGLKHLLDFSMAELLYKRGLTTGQKAVRRWFSGDFDAASTFLDSPANLPETHVLRSVSTL